MRASRSSPPTQPGKCIIQTGQELGAGLWAFSSATAAWLCIACPPCLHLRRQDRSRDDKGLLSQSGRGSEFVGFVYRRGSSKRSGPVTL